MLGTILSVVQEVGIGAIAIIVIAAIVWHKKLITWLRAELGIDAMCAKIDAELAENRVDTLKNSLLINLHNSPYKAEIIEADYKAYKDHGGNGYVDGVIEEWRESFEKGLIRRRLGTWNGDERRGREKGD
jgi:hypothetical protein